MPERNMVFQFSGLLFYGSFKSDKKEAIYFELEGSRLCINSGLSDKALILDCMERFDHSAGKT